MTTPTDRARPEDIPEDVWAIARKAYDDACLAEPEYGAQAVIARAILAAEKRGAAREREVALGAIDTLRESLMEGLMTDADLTDADRVAMNHQLEALGVAAATIRNRESDT